MAVYSAHLHPMVLRCDITLGDVNDVQSRIPSRCIKCPNIQSAWNGVRQPLHQSTVGIVHANVQWQRWVNGLTFHTNELKFQGAFRESRTGQDPKGCMGASSAL